MSGKIRHIRGNLVRRLGITTLIITTGLVLLIIVGYIMSYHDEQVIKTSAEKRVVDSLNSLSYRFRFRQVDSTYHYAQMALHQVHDYKDGMSKAYLNLLYVSYIKADYNEGMRLYHKLTSITNNQIYILTGEIFMMKLCLRTAQNRPYFDFYNKASQRVQRINEEQLNLNDDNKESFYYALYQLKLTNVSALVNQMQNTEALNLLKEIEADDRIRNDISMWLSYCYMKVACLMDYPQSGSRNILDAFDYLVSMYQMAAQYGYTFFEAVALQNIAHLLKEADTFEQLETVRPYTMNYLKGVFGSGLWNDGELKEYLPLNIAFAGLDRARKYNSILMECRANLILGDAYFIRGRYKEALKNYNDALKCVNLHHHICFPKDRGVELSSTGYDVDKATDLLWTKSSNWVTVPKVLVFLRERLSVTYSALGNAPQAQYNRDLYQKLLRLVSADKSIESRYVSLKEENKLWFVVLMIGIVISISCIILFAIYARLWKKRNKARVKIFNILCGNFLFDDLSVSYGRLDSIAQKHKWLWKERSLWLNLIKPYQDWMEKSSMITRDFDEQFNRLREERKFSEYRLEISKRKNISKRAKVTLIHSITPYIDLILNEISRIQRDKDESRKDERLAYIEEITDKIIACNDVLTQWIQLHRGEVNLTIENFAIQSLFDIINKGSYVFSQKGIQFTIKPTQAWAKADKILTLFMINTLVDNARKFTSGGGVVVIEAVEKTDAVEISVTDTGCGMTPDEVQLISSSKVYDAHLIGNDTDEIKKEKGYGFGLMNCKGIIEKYRKMNQFFDVCSFNVKSTKGKGSRFSFVLPKGTPVSRVMTFLAVVFLSMSQIKAALFFEETDTNMLKHARILVDSVSVCNTQRQFKRALKFADSARACLNHYYFPILPDSCKKESLRFDCLSKDEVQWLHSGVNADYRLILRLRNEVSISFQAMHDWKLSYFNNLKYKVLFYLLSRDRSLESSYLYQLDRRKNMRVGITVMVIFVLLIIVLIYISYFRRRMQFQINVMQVLETNGNMLKSVDLCSQSYFPDCVIDKLLSALLEGINEIHEISGLRILLYNGSGECIGRYSKGTVHFQELTDTLLEKTYETKQSFYDKVAQSYFYPLLLNNSIERDFCMGAITYNVGENMLSGSDYIFDELLARYLTILLYEIVIKHGGEHEKLEMEEGERLKECYEESRLHIQNQILDNCLSTIKHETMYYPSRIKYIIRNIRNNESGLGFDAQMKLLYEHAEYYKEIYMLLSSQADRQLSLASFRFHPIRIDEVISLWESQTKLRTQRKHIHVSLNVDHECSGLYLNTDKTLISLLLELITLDFLERAMTSPRSWVLSLGVIENDGFVRFALSSSVSWYTEEEIGELFTPDGGHYSYLVSKEIIREHEKVNNYCGCRINAELLDKDGVMVWFTIPKSNKYHD